MYVIKETTKDDIQLVQSERKLHETFAESRAGEKCLSVQNIDQVFQYRIVAIIVLYRSFNRTMTKKDVGKGIKMEMITISYDSKYAVCFMSECFPRISDELRAFQSNVQTQSEIFESKN